MTKTPKTKPAAKPKSAKAERAEALARMTKAELVRTVLTLDARQVKLLNDNARLQALAKTIDAERLAVAEGQPNGKLSETVHPTLPNPFDAPQPFPWEPKS